MLGAHFVNNTDLVKWSLLFNRHVHCAGFTVLFPTSSGSSAREYLRVTSCLWIKWRLYSHVSTRTYFERIGNRCSAKLYEKWVPWYQFILFSVLQITCELAGLYRYFFFVQRNIFIYLNIIVNYRHYLTILRVACWFPSCRSLLYLNLSVNDFFIIV